MPARRGALRRDVGLGSGVLDDGRRRLGVVLATEGSVPPLAVVAIRVAVQVVVAPVAADFAVRRIRVEIGAHGRVAAAESGRRDSQPIPRELRMPLAGDAGGELLAGGIPLRAGRFQAYV